MASNTKQTFWIKRATLKWVYFSTGVFLEVCPRDRLHQKQSAQQYKSVHSWPGPDPLGALAICIVNKPLWEYLDTHSY